MGYSRRTSNYPKRITLSNLTHMMSMTDLVAIGVEILRIDSGLFRKRVHIIYLNVNPLMVIILNVNQVDLCHGSVCNPLT